MKLYSYILKSLKFYRKQHLAILLGTILSTAVITGALIIGDSVQYSLIRMVDKRLGNVRFAMHTGDRFIRHQLIYDIGEQLDGKVAGGLILKGIAINNENQKRINEIQVLGINSSFWELSGIDMPDLAEDEVIISKKTAQKLNLMIGSEFLLRVENADIIPVNAPFVAESNPTVSFRLKVVAIANDKQLGRFGLQNNQRAPFNVFLSHEYLSQQIDLQDLMNFVQVNRNSCIPVAATFRL